MSGSPPSSTPPPPASRPYLHAIDRTDRGLARYELTSFFATPGALSGFVADLAAHFSAKLPTVDAVVGLDALGFVLAGALGEKIQKPVILARKGGKIAMPRDEVASSAAYDDYTVKKGFAGEGKVLEFRKDLLRKGMKVIIVDEWIDTGASMAATVSVLEKHGVEVVGIGTLHLQVGRERVADDLWNRYDVFAANNE